VQLAVGIVGRAKAAAIVAEPLTHAVLERRG
jgi:hypothetical protein